jgi:hypothetical protein
VGRIRTPYRDGTTQVAFEGAAIRTVDFIARLAALALRGPAKPRVNLTRYHGVLVLRGPTQPSLARAGHAGKARQRCKANRLHGNSLTRRAPRRQSLPLFFGYDLGSASCDAPLKRVFSIDPNAARSRFAVAGAW